MLNYICWSVQVWIVSMSTVILIYLFYFTNRLLNIESFNCMILPHNFSFYQLYILQSLFSLRLSIYFGDEWLLVTVWFTTTRALACPVTSAKWVSHDDWLCACREKATWQLAGSGDMILWLKSLTASPYRMI